MRQGRRRFKLTVFRKQKSSSFHNAARSPQTFTIRPSKSIPFQIKCTQVARRTTYHPTKPSSNGLIFLGNMCSLFKLTGFIVLVLLSMIVLARLLIVNLFFANPSWIGNIATITSYFFIGILLYKGISFFRNKYGRKLPGEDYD